MNKEKESEGLSIQETTILLWYKQLVKAKEAIGELKKHNFIKATLSVNCFDKQQLIASIDCVCQDCGMEVRNSRSGLYYAPKVGPLSKKIPESCYEFRMESALE